MRILPTPLLGALAAVLVAAPLAAQTPGSAIPTAVTPKATYGGPSVGDLAPDFTLPGATRFGRLAEPVKLSELKGHTVVLAFFPSARTRGCTIQLEKYRDLYATLFPSPKVVVLAVSTNADTTLVSWAKESSFPMLFGSDVQGTVGTAYGAYDPNSKYDRRLLYVIGPDGRVTYVAKPFDVSAEASYTDLAAAVRKTL